MPDQFVPDQFVPDQLVPDQKACYSLKFSGTDKVVIPATTSLQLGASLSIVAWVKVTANPKNTVILHQGKSGIYCGPYNMSASSKPSLGVEIRGGQGSLKCDPQANGFASTNTPTNSWFHIVGTYDGKQIKIYLNGKLDSTTSTASVAPYASAHGLWLGKNDGPHNGLQGNLRGVQVWAKALTTTEVAQSLSGTLNATSALKGWWPMSEGSGTTANDLSGNKNHGQISGAVWDTSCP